MDTLSGVLFIVFGANFCNLPSSWWLKVSTSSLCSDWTCLTKILLLLTKLFNISSFSKNMQFGYDEVILLIMLTIATLLQNIVILLFLMRGPHINDMAISANNSKYSTLGW